MATDDRDDLLLELASLLRKAAEDPVKVHTDYRARFARMADALERRAAKVEAVVKAARQVVHPDSIVDPQEAPLGYGQLRDALSRVAGIIQEETTK